MMRSAPEACRQHRQASRQSVGRCCSSLMRRGAQPFLPGVLAFCWHVPCAGGDGGQLYEARLMKKKMAGRHMAADCMHPHMAAAYGGGCPPPIACCAAPAGGINLARQVVQAETPVLSFLAHPAAVLTQLQLGPDGVLHIGPGQLQQLLAEAAGDAAAQAPASAAGGGVLAALGCRVVYAAVYDIAAPGQFGAAWAPCLQQEGVSNVQEPCGCLSAAAVRDMGLQRPVDPAVVSALVSLAYEIRGFACCCLHITAGFG